MPEPLPANRSRLNQAAKRFLRQVKADAHPLALYSLQLMEWGLKEGGLEVDSRVAATLENLLYVEEQDQETMDLLETVEPEGSRLNLLKGPLTPRRLAWRLLDSLESRVDLVMNLHPPKR